MARKIRALPSVGRLRELLEYDSTTGVLSYKGDAARRLMDTGSGYFTVSIDGQTYLSHRIIWKIVTGCDPVGFIDHADQVRSNNRFENLREADRSQNGTNRRKAKHNQSGFKGVHFDPARNRYRAQITTRGVQRRLGSFELAEDAYKAYCIAASKEHGRFASFS